MDEARMSRSLSDVSPALIRIDFAITGIISPALVAVTRAATTLPVATAQIAILILGASCVVTHLKKIDLVKFQSILLINVPLGKSHRK